MVIWLPRRFAAVGSMTASTTPETSCPITLADIYSARRRLAGHIARTPLVRADTLSAQFDADIYLKLDCLQPTGAFKLRGAANAVLQLDPGQRERGVVTVSTGNHGRAVVYAARALGIPARVFMSNLVPENKRATIRTLGAEVEIVGQSQDDAYAAAEARIADTGETLIPPFDHADIIAGQGTMGLEILEDLPGVDCLLVPLSGGGLLAGVATAVLTIRPQARVIGVSMERGAAMYQSLLAGQPVQVPEYPSYADSLGGGIGLDNRYTFQMVRQLVDQVLLLDEPSIARAMVDLLAAEKLLVEGASAICLAALQSGQLDLAGQTIVLLMTGNNVAFSTLQAAVRGLAPEEL